MITKDTIVSFLSYGITVGISKFIGVLLLPLYTRYYSASDYGIIDTIQTIISIILIFGILQLETALQRYYYEVTEDTRKQIASTILLFITILSVILMVILQITAVPLSRLCFNSNQYGKELSIAAFIIPLINISTISFIIIRYMKKPLLFGLITLMQVLITTGSTMFFILYCNFGILSVFYGQLLGYIILVSVQIIYLHNFYTFTLNFQWLKCMFDFALPQFPARIGSTASAYSNRFIMLKILPLSSIGIYSIALKCASVISIVQMAFSMVWTPYMYEMLNMPEHKSVFKYYFKYVCLGIGFTILCITLFSKELIQLVASREFYEAYYYIGGLSLYMGLFIINEYLSIGPRVTKKTSYISYTYFITAVLNILLLSFLGSLLGLKGIVWSMIGTNVIMISLSWFVSEKLYPIGFSKLLFVFTLILEIGIIGITMYFEISFLYRIIVFILLLILISIIVKLFRIQDKIST